MSVLNCFYTIFLCDYQFEKCIFKRRVLTVYTVVYFSMNPVSFRQHFTTMVFNQDIYIYTLYDYVEQMES